MKARTDRDLLAELEKDRADLDTAIAVIKRRLGVSSNGNSATASPVPAVQSEPLTQERPFLGKSILEATRMYLQRVREPKPIPAISEALRSGGVHSRSRDFPDIVRTTLSRNGNEAGIENFGNATWGLSEWRPGRTRATTSAPDGD